MFFYRSEDTQVQLAFVMKHPELIVYACRKAECG